MSDIKEKCIGVNWRNADFETERLFEKRERLQKLRYLQN